MTDTEAQQLVDEYTATMARALELQARLIAYLIGRLAGSGSGTGSGSGSTSTSSP